MRAYLSINAGTLECTNMDGEDRQALVFRTNPADVDAIEKCLRDHDLTGWVHSSSLDFAAEYGVPESVDVHANLKAAMERIIGELVAAKATEIVDGILWEANGLDDAASTGRQRAIARMERWLRGREDE